MAYAETTKVPFERSIAEIIGMVRKAGAEQIGQMEDRDYFAVQFTLGDRMVRFRVPFPSFDEMPKRDGRNHTLSQSQREGKLDQARRQRGRALMLVIKAKLESVESGVETMDIAVNRAERILRRAWRTKSRRLMALADEVGSIQISDSTRNSMP